jgi:hypothetical protein
MHLFQSERHWDSNADDVHWTDDNDMMMKLPQVMDGEGGAETDGLSTL